MRAKEKHRKRLIDYLANWENNFPNKTQMAEIIGLKQNTLYFHFTPIELDEILNDGLEQRKKNAAIPRAAIYVAMEKAAKDGNVPAQKEFLDRTEGKVVEKRELTGKDGTALFPNLSDEELDQRIATKLAEK